MIQKYFSYIVIGLLLIIFFQGFFNQPIYDEGLSEFKNKIIELSNDKIQLMDSLNQKDIDYEIIEKNVNVDSVIIWVSDRKFNDSIRAIVNPR